MVNQSFRDHPLEDYEKSLATQVVGDRRPLMAFSIPAAFFAVGCFYIFGSIEHLHGAEVLFAAATASDVIGGTAYC